MLSASAAYKIKKLPTSQFELAKPSGWKLKHLEEPLKKSSFINSSLLLKKKKKIKALMEKKLMPQCDDVDCRLEVLDQFLLIYKRIEQLVLKL